MAEYMMQDSGLTETIKEYSVSIKFLEENLQRGTFEEKNTNTAVLSDYQFIKFNHPLNEDGHSDNDTLSDLTELTRNYKWMDITEFVRKTYENLIASGNSVKETFEKQVDDIIYKNGNSDQVEDSGHIKKVTDADGSIKVLYRTYDYASNPVLEDTDFDGLRDDQDKLKLNNTFKGSSDDIGNVEYVNDYIREHEIDRVIFYSLNPHKETIYADKSQPASLYYAQVVAKVRLEFPEIEIICGTWIDNLANIGILILSGANGITKFPLFKMFGTKYGKRVEEEVKWANRQLKGTFTDKSKLGEMKSDVSPDLDKFIKRYIKESLKNKY